MRVDRQICNVLKRFEGILLRLMMNTWKVHYLLDFVKVLPTETLVEFKINDSEEPLLLTTQDGYLYVVMPLLSDD